MTYIRRAILALLLSCGLAPAFAQVPAAVPALPDTERRTSYIISGTTCACAVNFALYGDSTDYQNWVEVFINGVRYDYNDSSHGWTITSPSGSLATLARPITNAVLTFNAVQTGTVQIVGARRPRRAAQFNENAGVSARNFNQVFTDVIATQREIWDKTNDMTGRGIFGLPGETITALPSAALRSGKIFTFDVSGNPSVTSATPGLGNVLGPGTAVVNNAACWNSTDGTVLKDCGGGLPVLPTTYAVGDMLYASGVTTLSKLAAVAAGQPLVSDGLVTAPKYAGSWVNFDVTNKRIVLRKDTNTFPVPGATTSAAFFGPDFPGGESRLDVIANTSDSVLGLWRVNGTWASPTPVGDRQQIFGITGGSTTTNGGTAMGQGGYFGCFAKGAWTVSNHGFYCDIGVITNGTDGSGATLLKSARFSDAGGFAVNTADVFPALGVIDAGVGYTVNGAAASGSVLRGDGTKFVNSTFSLTGVAGKTFTFNNTLTLAGIDGTTLTFQGTDTYIGRATTDTLTNKTFNSSGTGNTLQISGVTVSRGQLPGVSTNTNATAGNIGEILTNTRALGSAAPASTGVSQDPCSLSVTAGEWDIQGTVYTTQAASTSITALYASISTTAVTFDFTEGHFGALYAGGTVPTASNYVSINTPTVRVSLSGTTTHYLDAFAQFSVSTLSLWCSMRATRVH